MAADGLMAAGAAVHAAEMPEREPGLLVGGGADEDLVGGRDDEIKPVAGLCYCLCLSDGFSFFGDLVYGPYDGDRVGDAGVATLRGGLEWLISSPGAGVSAPLPSCCRPPPPPAGAP